MRFGSNAGAIGLHSFMEALVTMSLRDVTRDRDLRAQARRWVVLLHSAAVDDVARQACAAWRQVHAAHEQAYREVERTWTLLGELGESAEAVGAGLVRIDTDRAKHRKYRWALAASLAVCAIASSLFLSATGGVRVWLADVRTVPGEHRVLRLADGTVVQLNSATAMSYHVDSARREVELVAGEAFFTVAHDAQRPFIVSAPPARIRVTGTRFNVRVDEDGVSLTVEDGAVAASMDGAAKEITVRPPERVTWQGDAQARPVAVDLQDVLAWRRDRIVFKSRPLGEVIDELSRYRRGRILLFGEATHARRVTGVFDRRNPDAVITAIEQTLPVSVIRITPYVTIIR